LNWPRLQPLPYLEDVSAYFECIRDLPCPVWLDSGRPALQQGRYDIIAADPVDTLRLQAGEAESALQRLRGLLGLQPARPCYPALPFCGGLIGYLGYELGRAWQGGRITTRERLAPDLYAGLYDWALVVDHQRQTVTLVGMGMAAATREHWSSLYERFRSAAPAAPVAQTCGGLRSTGLDKQAYAEAFARIQRYIRDGDIYQVNFTRRFEGSSEADPWILYQRLRSLSPAPYGAFLDLGDHQVLSNSPEQFLGLQHARVRTRPIKGTRPRGIDPQQDARLRADLAASSKDRAENLMIVDLLRNDLGRVCVPGSIEVPELFAIESYATVHHLVSTVQGRLREDRDVFDLLYACFPGGSITGAPKRRAMQIIDEVEPVSRELYCGSIFRLGYDGNLDSSISIRTLLRRDTRLYYWAGGGIVADSECAAEYQEGLDKAAAFFALLGVRPPKD
jgi:para-aminobenzoate synthetase component 1